MRAVPPTRPSARQHDRAEEFAAPVAVAAYVHQATGTAWLDVAGEVTAPSNLGCLLSQLRRAHRRIPREVSVVGVDLTRVEEVTIDLVVLLCLESRLLGVRGIELAIVLRDETAVPTSAGQMLERLQVWRVDADRRAVLTRAAEHARLGRQGWKPLGVRAPGHTGVRPSSSATH